MRIQQYSVIYYLHNFCLYTIGFLCWALSWRAPIHYSHNYHFSHLFPENKLGFYYTTYTRFAMRPHSFVVSYASLNEVISI